MGDVDKGDLVLIFQLLEQVDDVHFHGSIDSRNRFVGNDQLRTGDKRTCNGNTLQLAAGELGICPVRPPERDRRSSGRHLQGL